MMIAVDEVTSSDKSFSRDHSDEFNTNSPDKTAINVSIPSPSNSSMLNAEEIENTESYCNAPGKDSLQEVTFNSDKDLDFSDAPNSFQETVPSSTTETVETAEKTEEWMDIIGSGDFKKKIIKPGAGVETRPKRGDLVTINVSYCNSKGDLIEQHECFDFTISELDVIQGLDLAVNLMEKEEKAKILIPSRLAYGQLGRKPDIPPDCDLDCDVELLDVKEVDESKLSLAERLQIGNKKRDRGNFYYDRGEYLNAIHCYERACEYLDGVNKCADNSTEDLQNVLDVRIKIYNNMAATHLKLEAYDSALKSVEFVIKIQSNNVKAHFRKGKILAAKGLFDEAIACMRTASKFEPESKLIQNEITRLINKKKLEEKSQKEMYKRMFAPNSTKSKDTKTSSLIKKWSMLAGGVLAVAFSLVAYRQYHS